MLTRPPFVWLLALTAHLFLGCSQDETFVPVAGDGSYAAGGSQATGLDASGAAGEASENGASSGGKSTATVAPEPLLSDLVVEGVRVPLKPDFAPRRRRYSVLAEPEPQALSVTASADDNLRIQIQGKPVKSGQKLLLSNVSPGSDILIAVENSEGASRTYDVVYLPPDFPDIQILVNEPGASEDPIYVAMQRGATHYLAKLDKRGVPIFYKKLPRAIFDFKKHDNGEVSFAQYVGTSYFAEHVVLDENFEEIERVSTVGLRSSNEHEFRILPNGDYIVLGYEPMQHDLSAYGLSTSQWVVDATLQELSPDRKVLFQWSSWDHMVYGESQYLDRNYQDYSHINSIDVLPDGNWLLSSRGMSQLLKISRQTGKVIWRLGGVQNDFTFVDDPYGGLCGQHMARYLGNGHILLFDNGQYCWPVVDERGELTRVVEYEIDESKKTARLVWSFHRDGAYTWSQGSAQRLENGDTFIGWGLGPPVMATEVDPEGNIVFEFAAVGSDGVAFGNYRAYRFPD